MDHQCGFGSSILGQCGLRIRIQDCDLIKRTVKLQENFSFQKNTGNLEHFVFKTWYFCTLFFWGGGGAGCVCVCVIFALLDPHPAAKSMRIRIYNTGHTQGKNPVWIHSSSRYCSGCFGILPYGGQPTVCAQSGKNKARNKKRQRTSRFLLSLSVSSPRLSSPVSYDRHRRYLLLLSLSLTSLCVACRDFCICKAITAWGGGGGNANSYFQKQQKL